MTKRIFSLLFAVVLLLSLCLPVQALDVPQERNDCRVEILVRYGGKNITGGTLTIVKVGDVHEDDGNYSFRRVLDNAALEDVQTPEAAKSLDAFYKDNADFAFFTQTVNVTDGKAVFSPLPTGLYLVRQEKAANGYSKLESFLVSVPFLEDGKYQYDVTASAKTELEQEAVKKPSKPSNPSKPNDPSLPQTGQLNWPVPLLAIAGVVLFAAGWLIRFSKRKEHYEK